MMYCLYCILNLNNGWKYIGMTGHYEGRKTGHLERLKSNNHSCKLLQQHFNNGDSFEINIIGENFDKFEMMRMEAKEIVSTPENLRYNHNKQALTYKKMLRESGKKDYFTNKSARNIINNY